MATRLFRLFLALLLVSTATGDNSRIAGVLKKKRAANANQIIAATDSNIFRSPYNWKASGSAYIESNNPGAYIKTVFSGTRIALKFSVPHLSTAGVVALNYPALEWQVDGGAWTRVQLTSATGAVLLGADFADTNHDLEVHFVGCGVLAVAPDDRWNTPVQSLRISGLVINEGESLSAPTLRPGRMLVLGDSQGEGAEVVATGVSVAHQNARLAYGALLADRFDCEYGVVAFSFVGFNQTAGNVPGVVTSWPYHWSGQSRLSAGLLSPAPDYILSGLGQNDGADITTHVTTLIGALRTAAPDAPIFIASPPIYDGGYNSLPYIIAGVTAAADVNAFYLDTSSNLLETPAYTNGGTHLSSAGQIEYTDRVGDAMDAVLDLDPRTLEDATVRHLEDATTERELEAA